MQRYFFCFFFLARTINIIMMDVIRRCKWKLWESDYVFEVRVASFCQNSDNIFVLWVECQSVSTECWYYQEKSVWLCWLFWCNCCWPTCNNTSPIIVNCHLLLPSSKITSIMNADDEISDHTPKLSSWLQITTTFLLNSSRSWSLWILRL